MMLTASPLAKLLERFTYKDGWSFELVEDPAGPGYGWAIPALLKVRVRTTNSYPPFQPAEILHTFPVPPAEAFPAAQYRRWLLETIFQIERHEAAEFFEVDGVKVYEPHHGPGESNYAIRSRDGKP